MKAGTSVTPGYPGRKLQEGLLPDGLMDLGMGGSRDGGKELFWEVQLSCEKDST